MALDAVIPEPGSSGHEDRSFVQRFFDLAAGGRYSTDREATFYCVALLLQIHMSLSIGLWSWRNEHGIWQLLYPLACLAALHFVATRTYLKLGLVLTACMAVGEHVGTPIEAIPLLLANHNLLEYCCLGILLFVDRRDSSERQLGLAAMQWLVIMAIFSSGLQKVWHGSYFHGDFLAWSIANGRWNDTLASLLDPAELERLRSYAGAPFHFVKDQLISARPGPYRTRSTLLVLISNSVWILEISLPPALLVKRTRTVALIALIAMFAIIVTIVREAFFGMLVMNLLLLFARRNVHSIALPVLVLGYTVIGAAQTGLIPLTFPR